MSDQTLSIVELEGNLQDAEKPPEVPAGTYKAELQDVQEKVAEKSGNTYYAQKWVIPPDQLPADVREHYEDGAILFYNRLLRPDPRDRRQVFNLKQFMTAIGMPTNTNTIDPNEWMGRQARIRVKMGKNLDGEPRAEISGIEAHDEAPARGAGKAESNAAPKRGARR